MKSVRFARLDAFLKMRFLCRFAGMMDGTSEQVTCHETKDRFICEMMIRNPHVPISLTRKIG